MMSSTKIAQMVSLHLTGGGGRAVDKNLFKWHCPPEPLVQIENNFTNIYFCFQKALEVTESMESILKDQAGTRELLPSQKRRLRELQLPDGMKPIFNLGKCSSSCNTRTCYTLYNVMWRAHHLAKHLVSYLWDLTLTVFNLLIDKKNRLN